jgi:hypothetical protein
MPQSTQRKPYQAPTLEAQAVFVVLTGVSLPIGTSALSDLELGLNPKEK